MKKTLFLLTLLAGPLLMMAQFGAEPKDTSWKKIFRESNPKEKALVYTRQDIKFDLAK